MLSVLITAAWSDILLNLANDQLAAYILSTFITILYMYMFRAISCSSSGGQIVLIQHLVLSLSVNDLRCTCALRNFAKAPKKVYFLKSA
jgi:hypothetical protein